MPRTNTEPVIINNIDDKFETLLFSPKNLNVQRFGEDCLRKKKIFKIGN